MFDIGTSELLVIFIVALLVIGPERLPGTVRTASLWIGRLRRSFHKIKAEVEKELNADEIRRQLHNESILAEVEEAKQKARQIAQEAEKAASLDIDGTDRRLRSPGTVKADDKTSVVEKGSGDRSAGSIVADVKKELGQAVSYVNDISREVKENARELEQELDKDSSGGNTETGEKK